MFSARKRASRRCLRIRRNIKALAIKSGRLRLSVFRSSKKIYAQVIDDIRGVTIVAASPMEKALRDDSVAISTGLGMAKKIGKLVAKRAIEAGIKRVVFDRGGYKYHGCVQALADSAREAGLDF